MSFWRHEEIYRSDVGLGEARNGNGCRRSPHSSAAMSFQSAIPQQVALQQCLPLLHRLQTILNNQCCRTMILQRTATTPLTPCLSSRVHSTSLLPLSNPVFALTGYWICAKNCHTCARLLSDRSIASLLLIAR